MTDKSKQSVRAADYGLPLYFDLQAKMGHTKHLGGIEATNKLASFCHLAPGKTVLNVGSGSGISAAYLAENFECQVVGVDLLPGMVKSAQNWAREKGLEDLLDFRLGDAQDLPFDANQFDAVICESVNVFVPDKAKAMSEYGRVVKPGGYVGLAEAIWVNNPSQEMSEMIVEATGQQFETPELWECLLREAGLVELVVENHSIQMREESRNQTKLLSLKAYLRILGRAFKILITDSEIRTLLKYMGSNPKAYFEYMGYGLFVGRKPR